MDSSSSQMQTGPVQATVRQWEMDVLVGRILQAGVLLSLALIAAGMAWFWLRTDRLGLSYHLAGMNLFEFVVREVGEVAHGAVRPRLLVNLGITILMLTPLARVMASVVYFAVYMKDWKYTVFTSFVLAVLTFSLFLR